MSKITSSLPNSTSPVPYPPWTSSGFTLGGSTGLIVGFDVPSPGFSSGSVSFNPKIILNCVTVYSIIRLFSVCVLIISTIASLLLLIAVDTSSALFELDKIDNVRA